MTNEDTSGLSFPVRKYRELRRVMGATAKAHRPATSQLDPAAEPFAPGRDPRLLGPTFDALVAERGWEEQIAGHTLFSKWSDIVGEDNAKHATPVSLTDGVLQVKCASTSWATQLRLMKTTVIAKVHEIVPAAELHDVRFSGPDAPSWKRGVRSVPGRGPRDTYG